MFIHFILCFLLLCFQQKALSEIEYEDFSQVSSAYSPKEQTELRQVYKENKVFDLEKSGLLEFSSWLTRYIDRVQPVIDSMGESFSYYQIKVLRSANPNDTFIYKIKPPGTGFYRGHVFISAGLIQLIINKLKIDLVNANREDLELILKAIVGVLTHEFTHPKQDELVKWGLRQARDESHTSHGKIDEASTDIMALTVLRDAELEVDSLLHALTYSDKENSTTSFSVAGIIDVVSSSHPEKNLRPNLIRGAMANQRQNEGGSSVNPIDFDFQSMRNDLLELTTPTSLQEEINSDYKSEKYASNSQLEANGFALKKFILKDSVDEPESRKKLSQYFELFNSHLNEKTSYSESDRRLVLSVFEIIFKKNIRQLMPAMFGLALDDQWHRSIEESDALVPQESNSMGFLGNYISQMKIFEDPIFLKEFESLFASNFRDNSTPNRPITTEKIALLPLYLPKTLLEPYFIEIFESLDSFSGKQGIVRLIALWVGVNQSQGNIDLEVKVVRKLVERMRDQDSSTEYLGRMLNTAIIPASYPAVFNSRALYNKLEKSKALISAYKELTLLAFKNPQWQTFTPLYTPYHAYAAGERFVFFWNSILAVEGRNGAKLYKAESNLALRDNINEIIKILENSNWSQLIREAVPQAVNNSIQKTDLYKVTPLSIVSSFSTQFSTIPALARRPKLSKKVLQKLLFHPVVKEIGLQEKSVLDYQWYIANAVDYGASPKNMDRVLLWMDELARLTSKEFALDQYLLRAKPSTIASRILDVLYKKNFLNLEKYSTIIDSWWFSEDLRIPNGHLLNFTKDDIISIYKVQRKMGASGIELLKKYLELLNISKYDHSDPDIPLPPQYTQNSIKRSQAAGLDILSDYTKLFDHLRPLILQDFLTSIGYKKNASKEDKGYQTLWKNNWEEILVFAKLVFAPNKALVPKAFQSSLDFSLIDRISRDFVRLIPESGLSQKQYFELWKIITHNRSNKHTDELVFKHFYDPKNGFSKLVSKISPMELLDQQRVKSEFIVNSVARKILDPKIIALSKTLEPLDTAAIVGLMQLVLTYIPNPSRFRDNLLEDISWDLQLSRKNLKMFVEPQKSFSLMTLDPRSVDLLSLLSYFMLKLKNLEKLQLIDYIREPFDSVYEAVPRLGRLKQNIINKSTHNREKYLEAREAFDTFEFSLRDLSHVQRTLLIENIVGSNKIGLWYQGEFWREELLSRIKIGAKNSETRLVFEHYLEKGLPQWEKTFAVSAMLAAIDEVSDKSLPRFIAEMHKAPGEKFAQMASIMSILGEEYNEDLARTKDQASPPSRLEVLQRLEELYGEYASKMKVIKLLGSGSIKYVVLVELDSGTRIALSVKKRNLDKTNESVIGFASAWAESMASDPKLNSKFDFRYYVESLKQQLERESDFKLERLNSAKMAKIIAKLGPHRGWKMDSVDAYADLDRGQESLAYIAMENLLAFEDLNPEEKQIASELITKHEISLIFDHGIFDADRHLGNYLFSPSTQTVLFIDYGQVYHLRGHKYFVKGDAYKVAKLLLATSESDYKKASKTIANILISFHNEGKLQWQGSILNLESELEEILSSVNSLDKKVQLILSKVNQQRIHLPLRIGMGVMKDLLIVTNEVYAKYTSPLFTQKEFEKKLMSRILKASPLEGLGVLATKTKEKIRTRYCKDTFTP